MATGRDSLVALHTSNVIKLDKCMKRQ